MPYMRKPSVLRPFVPRGMGASVNCAWGDYACVAAALGGSVPAGTTAPPPASAPAAPQTVEQMTVPGAYTPEMSQQATGAQSLQNWQNYFQGLDTSGGNNDTSACDWTQAAWLDPTTWCGANWAMAGLVAFGVVMFFKMGGRR